MSFQAGQGAAPQKDRDGLPALRPPAEPHRARQHPFGLEIEGVSKEKRRKSAEETLDLGRPPGPGREADDRALRGYEAARRPRAGARDGAGDTPHGRALLGARPPDPARHAEPFPLHPGRGTANGRFRHPRPRRGADARAPGRDHEGRGDRPDRQPRGDPVPSQRTSTSSASSRTWTTPRSGPPKA